MHLSKDLREFVELLNSHLVEYLVVGGFAVAWHGHPRFTGDIDIFVRSTDDNARRVVATLRAFGFGAIDVDASDLIQANRVFQLGVPPNRIDLITTISGVSFDQAWANRVAGTLDGIPVQYIGLDDLICNKEAARRGKDLGDALELRRRRKSI